MTASLREAVAEKVEVRVTGIAETRKKRTASWLVLALVALNVAGAIFLVQSRASLTPTVREAFRDVEIVAQAVEASRDANRKVPATLAEISPPLPTTIADRVRRGEIRYRPSEDRSTFTVEAALDPSVVDSEPPAEPAGQMP